MRIEIRNRTYGMISIRFLAMIVDFGDLLGIHFSFTDCVFYFDSRRDYGSPFMNALKAEYFRRKGIELPYLEE